LLPRFPTHYPNKDYAILGRINACPTVLCGDENLALNTGKKILDNPELYFEKQLEDEVVIMSDVIFKKDIGNYHIMITPCRTIISELLMAYAVVKDYNPVVIGLYNSSINIRYKDNTGKYKKNKDGSGFGIRCDISKEFNENLYVWLREKKLLNRPVIIFGNYQSLGESNTFVNSDYGYLRSTILLPGCNLNEEKHYQFLLRGCFLLEKFIGLTKNTVEKFIISHEKGIKDALAYEDLNDEIVQDLIDNPNESEFAFEYSTSEMSSTTADNNNNKIIYSIPVQFKIEDDTCKYVKHMKRIMEKDIRTVADKTEFMENLIKAIEDTSIIKYDKNPDEIILDKFKLSEFRCYKEGYTPDNYRFKGYYDKWRVGQSHTNGDLNVNECGIYSCLKKHKSSDGHINNPNTFYILFAYLKNTPTIEPDNKSIIDLQLN